MQARLIQATGHPRRGPEVPCSGDPPAVYSHHAEIRADDSGIHARRHRSRRPGRRGRRPGRRSRGPARPRHPPRCAARDRRGRTVRRSPDRQDRRLSRRGRSPPGPIGRGRAGGRADDDQAAGPRMTVWPAITRARAATARMVSATSDRRVIATAVTRRLPVVALVGRPNVGKSTFVARLTGRYEEAANVPGTTVGTVERQIDLDGHDAILVDLPGAYSLTDRSDGLPPFWQMLLDARPDAILSVVDAGELALHLPLVLACRDLGLPIVVAANLADEAEAHGIELDLGRLSQLLAAPVHRTVGRRGTGIHAALADAIRLAEARRDAA